MNSNEIKFADGTRLTIGGTWWRFDKSTSAGAVFCRWDGREIVAGRFAGGEDVPMLKVQTVDITPEAMREIGKGICRALHNALLEDLCCIAENGTRGAEDAGSGTRGKGLRMPEWVTRAKLVRYWRHAMQVADGMDRADLENAFAAEYTSRWKAELECERLRVKGGV